MGLLKKIFGKSDTLKESVDLSVLEVDIHSHLIPSIDDGSKNMDETINLLLEFKKLGYRKVITTPHTMSDYYRNTSSIILSGRDKVREELVRRGIDLEFDAASEYFLDEHFEELIAKKDLLTFGNNYVLFELSFVQEPMALSRVIFELQTAGYRPVLAHPERYPYFNTEFEKYHSFLDKGVILQLNLNSISGGYTPSSKKIAHRLIAENMIQIVGSDCHHMGHMNGIKMEASKMIALKELIDSDRLLNSSL